MGQDYLNILLLNKETSQIIASDNSRSCITGSTSTAAEGGKMTASEEIEIEIIFTSYAQKI